MRWSIEGAIFGVLSGELDVAIRTKESMMVVATRTLEVATKLV